MPARRGLIMAACLMAQFMAAVEGTIIATAMPTIVAELGGFHLFSWTFASYLLAQAVTTPIYGKLSDVYGRKRVFFVGAGLFIASSAACGFAWGMVPLIIFRTLQGLGAGGVQPIAWTIIGDIHRPEERARAQAWLSTVWSSSAVGGPLLGAFIVEHLHWSLIFWINVPVGLATIAVLAACLKEHRGARRRQVDYPGAALLMLATGALMLLIVQGDGLGAAGSAGCGAVGALAFAGLVLHERRVREPIVPFKLWRERILAIGNFGTFAIGALMMANTAFLPTYIQGPMGRSPTISGLVIGVSSVSWTLAIVAAGRMMARGSYRRTGALGGIIVIAGTALLIALTPERGPLWAALGACVASVGMGFANTTFLVAVQTSVGWGERGTVTAANMFMRAIGQSLGAGVYGAILNRGVAARVPGAGGAVDRLMDPHTRASLAPAMVARLGEAIAGAMHDIYLITGLLAVAVLALTLGIPAGASPTRPATDRRAAEPAAAD